MAFAHPTWLLALLALPLVAAWVAWSASLRRRRLARYADPALWPTVAGTISWPKKRIKSILRLAALAFLIVAAARPQWGVKERPLVREGSDILICLDVSNSMLARDIQPSRLAAAKQQIKSLIYSLKGDRIGLVLFAGEAFVQCPLTLDYGLAASLLDAASPDAVSIQGTRIGPAIDTAVRAFDRSALGTKSIILVTDGEDQGSDPLAAAQQAAKDRVVIECVGIGSPDGVPILMPSGKYKEDRQGRKVTSRLDVDTLGKIALATGGEAVVTGPSGNLALDSLYNAIKNFEKRQFESTEVSLLEDRFQWPLGAALLLLAAELLLTDRARRNGERTQRGARGRRAVGGPGRWLGLGRAAGKSAGVAAAFLLLSAAPQPARAEGWEFGNRAARLCQQGNLALDEEDFDTALSRYHDAKVLAPDNPVLDYNIGVALARRRKYDEARTAFEIAARRAGDNPELRAKAHYNAAYTDFQQAQGLAAQQKLDDAIRFAGRSIDSNQRALRSKPDFEDARHNLDESRQLLSQLVELKQQAMQQPQQGDQPQEQQQSGQGEQGEEEQQQQDEGTGQEEERQQQAGEEKQEEQEAQENKEQAKQEGEEKEAQAAEAGEESQQPPVGEMTREDAIRLLSTLPDEDPQALQKALRGTTGNVRLERDW